MYAAFPLEELADKALAAVRVNFFRNATDETVVGRNYAGCPSKAVWVLIHRGHMRCLVPPEGDPLKQLAHTQKMLNEIPALG